MANNLQITRQLLNDSRVDINWKDCLGMTPLMLAVAGGRLKMTQLLLADDRIDVNAEEGNGYSALMLAVVKGYEGVVKELLFLRKDHIVLDNQHPEHNDHIHFMEAKVRKYEERMKRREYYHWSLPRDPAGYRSRRQSKCLELCREALEERAAHNGHSS